MKEQALMQARTIVDEYNLRDLFSQYGFLLVLHWHGELQQYELRARSSTTDKYVGQLEKFIQKTEQEQRKRLAQLQAQL